MSPAIFSPHQHAAAVSSPVGMTWRQFCELYEREGLPQLKPSLHSNWRAAARRFAETCSIRLLSDVTPIALSVFRAAQINSAMSVNTLKSYQSRLSHALKWAAREGMIDAARFGIRVDAAGGFRWPRQRYFPARGTPRRKLTPCT